MSSSDRQMFPTTCADCKKETQVPFKPTEGRPVYCKECLPKHRPARSFQAEIRLKNFFLSSNNPEYFELSQDFPSNGMKFFEIV